MQDEVAQASAHSHASQVSKLTDTQGPHCQHFHKPSFSFHPRKLRERKLDMDVFKATSLRESNKINTSLPALSLLDFTASHTEAHSFRLFSKQR